MALTHPAAGSLWRRTRARSLRWVARYAAVVPDAPNRPRRQTTTMASYTASAPGGTLVAGGLVGLAGVIAGGLGVFLGRITRQVPPRSCYWVPSSCSTAVQGTAIIKAGKDTVELER